MNVQDVVRAEELVARALDDDAVTRPLSYAGRLQHVVDTVALDQVRGDDELAEAYRVVLAYHTQPSRADLLNMVFVLAQEGAVRLSTAQRVWLLRAERAELY